MIWGKLKLWAALAGGAVLAVLGAFIAGRREGKTIEKGKGYEQNAKAQERGRDALRDGRDSGLSPADRLRRNDGDWRGL